MEESTHCIQLRDIWRSRLLILKQGSLFERIIDACYRRIQIVIGIVSIIRGQRELSHARSVLAGRGRLVRVRTYKVGIDGHLRGHGKGGAVCGDIVCAIHGVREVIDTCNSRVDGHGSGRVLIQGITGCRNHENR